MDRWENRGEWGDMDRVGRYGAINHNNKNSVERNHEKSKKKLPDVHVDRERKQL